MENVFLTSVNREVPLPTADLSVWEGIPWWASEWRASAEVITESFPTCSTTGVADLLIVRASSLFQWRSQIRKVQRHQSDSWYQKDGFVSSKPRVSEMHVAAFSENKD